LVDTDAIVVITILLVMFGIPLILAYMLWQLLAPVTFWERFATAIVSIIVGVAVLRVMAKIMAEWQL